MKRLLILLAAVAIVLPSCHNEMPECDHLWKDSVCEICGEECQHSWKDGVCEICGKECLHSWKDGVCEICGKGCDHSWKDGVCEICGKLRDLYDETTNTYYAASMKGLRAWCDAVVKNPSANLIIARDIVCEESCDWYASDAEGLIEGNGHTIKGWSGKFFILDLQNGGAVQNLNFADVNIENTGFFGCIIARVDEHSRVSNCRVSGSIWTKQDSAGIVGISSGTIANCINEATVYAGSYGAGGIVGVNYINAKVVACLNLSTSVSGGQTSVGSIAGQNYGNIYGCLGVISTSGEGANKATNCAGYNARDAKAEGCVVVNSMADVTAEHIATMNDAIAAMGYSHRWVAGENGEAPSFTSAE